MKPASTLLTFCGVSLTAAFLFAPGLAAQTAPLSPSTPGHPQVLPAIRPPRSVTAPAHARVSTAERMAAMHNDPPLQELPAFTASNRDGKPFTAKAATQTKSGHWLLIYRKAECLPCDRLMNVLAASENSSIKSGQPFVIVVAGKRTEALEKVHANFAALGDATWLADKNDQAYAALKPRGTPMIYAMDGNKIKWSIPGNLGDPARVDKIASAWVSSTPSTSTTVPGPSPAATAQ